jgi:hypothetical protein
MLRPTHREAIREIFLRRRIEYTTQQVASLLRMNLGEVLQWIDSGILHADVKRKRRQLGGPRHALISWNELASAAMLRWNVMQIHDALGEHANRVLPRLLRPVEMKSLRLPEYQVRLIEAFARHQGVSIEEYVYTALLSLEVMGDADEVETLLPGFKEAMSFPEAL